MPLRQDWGRRAAGIFGDLYTSLPKSIYSILYGSSSMLAGLLSRVADADMGPALAVAERGFGIASRIVPSATVTIGDYIRK